MDVNDEDERFEPAIMMTMFYDMASFIVYELISMQTT